MAIIKPVKVFSRTDPCTKVHLHNCFAGVHQYIRRPVVEAQGEIGTNSIKYLLKKGYAVYRQDKGIDYYELTAEGTIWLRDGLAAHLKRHPDDRVKVESFLEFRAPTVPLLRVARTKLKEQ